MSDLSVADRLSGAARYPIVGYVASGGKIVMGVLQVITALAIAILTVPCACCNNERASDLNQWGLENTCDGLKNFFVGIVESIPIIGWICAEKNYQAALKTQKEKSSAFESIPSAY